ncbi:MAG: hypothetical protein J0L62_03465 [Bacteroidetes bacterium]|nr:hypothetical protein [Bacteroidota bacterium]
MKYLLILLVILAAACSSVPENLKKPTESVRSARDQMQKGIRASLQENHEQAIQHFQTAYGYYTQVDEIKGKIRSCLAVARQYLLVKKGDLAEPWVNNAKNLITLYQPELQSSLLLLQVEQLFISGQSDSVIKLTDLKFEASPEISGQIWAYRLLSRDRLRQEFEDELEELESAVDDMTDLKDDNELEDPYAYSYCSYLTGWAYYANTDFKKALLFYNQAYQTDRELENLRGLADDVFGIAQTNERLKAIPEAIAGYYRATEMYRQADRSAEAEDAEFRLLRLKLPENDARAKLQELLKSTSSELLKIEIKSLLEKPDSLFRQNRNPD